MTTSHSLPADQAAEIRAAVAAERRRHGPDQLPTPDETALAHDAASGRIVAHAIRTQQAISGMGISLDDLAEKWRPSARIIWNVPAAQAVQVLIDHGHDRAMGQLPDPGTRTTSELVADLRQAKSDHALWTAITKRSRAGIMQAILDHEAEPSPGPAFPFQSMAELVAVPHPIEWLLKPFLTKDSLCTVYGDSGTYKTFVVLGVCVSIASGLPWLGEYTPRVSGPVFYICGEGFSGIAGRLRGQCLGYGIDGQDIPLFVSGVAVQVLDADSVARMVAAIDELAKEHGQPVLIVLDTLSRCFGPGNENDTPDMARYIAELDRIRSKYGCTIINVHHTGIIDKTRGRGSGAHRAALDIEYRVDTTNTDDKRLVCTKSKDAEPPADIYLTPEVIPLGWRDEDGDELTTLFLHASDTPAGTNKPRPRLTGAQRIALQCLTRLSRTDDGGYEPVHIDDWRAKAYQSGITPSADASAKRKAFSRAVRALQDGYYIECANDHYTPSSGTDRDKPGHCPDMYRDGPGHPSIEGVPCPALSAKK